MNMRRYKGINITPVQLLIAFVLGVLEVIILHVIGGPGLALVGVLALGLGIGAAIRSE